MKDRAMMLGKVALARGAMELSPETATGMAVGTEVAQPEPAAIATARMGIEMLGGINRARASVRGGHRIGPDRRRWLGLPGLLCTHRTVRLVRQALERFGLGGTLGLDGWGWRVWRGRTSP